MSSKQVWIITEAHYEYDDEVHTLHDSSFNCKAFSTKEKAWHHALQMNRQAYETRNALSYLRNYENEDDWDDENYGKLIAQLTDMGVTQTKTPWNTDRTIIPKEFSDQEIQQVLQLTGVVFYKVESMIVDPEDIEDVSNS